MTMKKTRPLLLVFLSTWPVAAQWPVIDLANLQQALVQVMLASNQVFMSDELLKRLGDPAAIQQIVGAAQTLQQLGRAGVARSLREIQLNTTGQSGLTYDGYGLYRPVDADIPLAGGKTTARPTEAYKKFEALQEAVADFNSVTVDTKARRTALRDAQRQTTEQLKAAKTDAETQKLQAVLAAQQSEIANLAAERSEAAARVIIQQASNDADKARQDQADLELRAASLQSALKDAMRFFKADSHPTLLPDPKQVSP